jgi:hypothetical protein
LRSPGGSRASIALESTAASAEYAKAIIILSDGLNTEDRWYTSASQIDARQRRPATLKGGWDHALHDPGQHRLRSDVDAAAKRLIRLKK